jgi:hypothetical protein
VEETGVADELYHIVLYWVEYYALKTNKINTNIYPLLDSRQTSVELLSCFSDKCMGRTLGGPTMKLLSWIAMLFSLGQKKNHTKQKFRGSENCKVTLYNAWICLFFLSKLSTRFYEMTFIRYARSQNNWYKSLVTKQRRQITEELTRRRELMRFSVTPDVWSIFGLQE